MCQLGEECKDDKCVCGEEEEEECKEGETCEENKDGHEVSHDTPHSLRSFRAGWRIQWRIPPPSPNGTQFFRFRIRFCRKAPASKVGAPPMGRRPPIL